MATLFKVFGVAIALLGALALLDSLHVFRFDNDLVRWTNRWGTDASWVIRIGLLMLGLSLVFMAPRGDD